MSVDWRNLPPVPEEERPELHEGWRPSQTFLSHHDRCDRAAMLYLKYRGGAGGHQLNRGAAVHEVLARLTRLAIEEGEEHIGSPEVAKDELIAYLAEHPELQLSAAERDSARYMVANFAEGEWFTNVLAVELTLTLELGGYEIICRPDRVDDVGAGTLEVVDYKTAFSPPESDEWVTQSFDSEGNPRYAGDFQTLLYAVAVAFGVAPDGRPLGEGFERFKLSLVYPRHLRPTGLLRRTVVVSQQQLLDFRLDVEAQLRRLREVNFGEGRWQPTPGTHCARCPAEYACPLPRLLRPESQHANLGSREELEAAAQNAYWMAKRARELKARVKKAAEGLPEQELDLGVGRRGVRIGRDKAFEFKPITRETIRDKAVMANAVERARSEGEPFNWTDHVRISDGVEFTESKVNDERNGR